MTIRGHLACFGAIALASSAMDCSSDTSSPSAASLGEGGRAGAAIGEAGAEADGSTGGSSAARGGSNLIVTGDAALNADSSRMDVSQPTCGETAIEKTAKVVNVLLVIDESASMANPNKPAGFAVTKWEAIQTSLSTALSRVKGGLNFGLELFPYDPGDASTNACTMPDTGDQAVHVPVAPGSTSVPAITALMARAIPSGGTPTAVALQRAYDYFKHGHGASLIGDNYVLLTTDGAPNCGTAACEATECTENVEGRCDTNIVPNCCLGANDMCLDRQGTVDAIAALRADGVKTVIVGIPGTELYQAQLDAFAEAGGMPASSVSPKYYRVDGSPDGGSGVDRLTDVFTRITEQLITTCRQQLTTDPPDMHKLNVSVDGIVVPSIASQGNTDGAAAGEANTDAATSLSTPPTDGWSLDTSTTPPTIALQGPVCDHIKSEGANVVQVLYGCPTVIR